MKKKRKCCRYCGQNIGKKKEDGTIRDFCSTCGIFLYDNPSPVVSVILLKDRDILLVKRGKKPYKGKWCLPSGFAETGESVEQAALRELEEETGVKGSITGLVDVDSCVNYFYGDLIFLTFEAEQIGGNPYPGDDATDLRYFPIMEIPKLAFSSNIKAVETYIRNKKDYWAITDSFLLSIAEEEKKKNLLSDKLVELIEKNSELIAWLWIKDVTVNKSTPHYHGFDHKRLFTRVNRVFSHFGKWLEGSYKGKDIESFYTDLGEQRKKEGFALSEVISALSLSRKHIWEFALSQGIWHKTIDIYMALELEQRMMLFFDRATFYTTKGYETRAG
jgi:8-oxo-dGTP diphosphatase